MRSPYLVALVVLVAGPLAWWSSSGERLAMCNGDLMLTRYWWWGAGERIVGRIEGGSGYWWIVYPSGESEAYAWEHAPAVLKVSPNMPPPRQPFIR